MVESKKRNRKKRNLPEGAAAGGAAGLSALGTAAGLCCVGPWTVALFGVGGAVFLSQLEPFRPLMLIVAAGLLGWAFWRVYRPPGGMDALCARRRAPLLKATLWISAGLLAMAFFARDLQALIFRLSSLGAGL